MNIDEKRLMSIIDMVENSELNNVLIETLIMFMAIHDKLLKENKKNHNALEHARLNEEQLYSTNIELRNGIKFASDNLIILRDMLNTGPNATITKADIVEDINKIITYLKPHLPVELK